MADLMVMKMYTATVGDAAASMDMPLDGMIVGVLFQTRAIGADVLNEGVFAELSFASTSGFAANDTRASIAGVANILGAITTGGANMAANVPLAFGADGIPVSAGERLYLHTTSGGTVTIAVSCWVYIRVTGLARADRRRL
jgi:hypothetical protein